MSVPTDSAPPRTLPDADSLFAWYHRYLLKIANEDFCSSLRVKVAASDLVQETLHAAVQSYSSFRGSTEQELRAWLRSILERRVVDAGRRYRVALKRQLSRETALPGHNAAGSIGQELPPATCSPEHDALARERQELLQRGLDNISPQFKDVILRHSFDRQTFTEIATETDRSPDSVRKLWHRAIAALNAALRRHDPDFHERL